jgi:hypothetical protein
VTIEKVFFYVKVWLGILLDFGDLKIRAADAKEVGVGNPAEETCCYPNKGSVTTMQRFVNTLMVKRGDHGV